MVVADEASVSLSRSVCSARFMNLPFAAAPMAWADPVAPAHDMTSKPRERRRKQQGVMGV